MKSPTKAIKKLWEDKFFKVPRRTKAIEEEVWKRFGCSCSNWSAILKNCKFLRRKKDGWRQKYSPLDVEKEIYLVSGEKPWTDRNKEFIKLVEKLKGEILILDPYYGIDTLQILSNFSKNKKIKFMASQLGRDENIKLFKKELSRFKKEFKNVEIKIYPKFYELHDRYVISDNFFIVIGHGLKDLGSRECFLIAIPSNDIKKIINILKIKFKERWKKSQNLK